MEYLTGVLQLLASAQRLPIPSAPGRAGTCPDEATKTTNHLRCPSPSSSLPPLQGAAVYSCSPLVTGRAATTVRALTSWLGRAARVTIASRDREGADHGLS